MTYSAPTPTLAAAAFAALTLLSPAVRAQLPVDASNAKPWANHGVLTATSPQGATDQVIDTSLAYGHVVPTSLASNGRNRRSRHPLRNGSCSQRIFQRSPVSLRSSSHAGLYTPLSNRLRLCLRFPRPCGHPSPLLRFELEPAQKLHALLVRVSCSAKALVRHLNQQLATQQIQVRLGTSLQHLRPQNSGWGKGDHFVASLPLRREARCGLHRQTSAPIQPSV